MGTSTSSSGPGPGVPFDPPWLDTLGDELQGAPTDGQPADGNSDDADEANVPDLQEQSDDGLAPARRFAPARRELGGFAKTGDGEAFRRAVGHYSRTGMGGARRAASRMRASTVAAGGLVS